MTMDVRVYQSGKLKDPDSLQNGHVLQVCASLTGVLPLAEQIEDPAGQMACLMSSLEALYGASKVTETTSADPYIYKFVWVDGEGWVRVCCFVGSLQIQFSTAAVVKMDFEVGNVYSSSSVTATAVS